MNNDLTVNVNVELTVAAETAERAAQILNMYLKDNPTIKPSITLHDERTPTDWRRYYQINL